MNSSAACFTILASAPSFCASTVPSSPPRLCSTSNVTEQRSSQKQSLSLKSYLTSLRARPHFSSAKNTSYFSTDSARCTCSSDLDYRSIADDLHRSMLAMRTSISDSRSDLSSARKELKAIEGLCQAEETSLSVFEPCDPSVVEIEEYVRQVERICGEISHGLKISELLLESINDSLEKLESILLEQIGRKLLFPEFTKDDDNIAGAARNALYGFQQVSASNRHTFEILKSSMSLVDFATGMLDGTTAWIDESESVEHDVKELHKKTIESVDQVRECMNVISTRVDACQSLILPSSMQLLERMVTETA